MSKRLRASMRAANKGRNLRPRTSQVPPEAGPSEAAESVKIQTAAPTSAPLTAPSADRGRPTLREPALEDPEDTGSDEDDDADDAAPIALVGKAPSEPPAAVVPPPRAPLEDTQPSSPAVLMSTAPAKVEVKKTASTAPPVHAPAEAFKETKAEEPKAAPAPAKAEVAPAPAKAEEPKAAPAPAKVEAPKARAEEPKARAEEPKARAEEPKKAAPAPAPAAKPVVAPKPPVQEAPASKKGKAEEQRPAPSSKKGGALRAVRDGEGKAALEGDIDASSISAEFFRKDVDSLPPVEEHEHELESMAALVLSPSTLARRARLRRLVAGVVAFAGVISIAVIGKQVSAMRRTPVAPVSTIATEARRETPPPPAKEEAKPAEPEKAAATEPAKAQVDDKKPDEAAAKKEDAKPDEAAAKKEDAKPDDKKPDEAAAKKEDAKPEASAVDVAALKKETESLLNRGRNKEAIEKAREAIAADPADAISYLFLGTALQATGKWKEGVEAYCDCVRNATKGSINECRAMGGHK
jgi:hypothetical protein